MRFSDNMTTICGIDDAGRGPVIGPMVMAGIVIEDEQVLKKIGAKDSKKLTPKARKELFQKIIGLVVDYKVKIITPEEIDHALTEDHLNLNLLEAIKMAEIVNELEPDKAIIDCPSPNCSSFMESMRRFLKVKSEIILEHKADVNHPSVAARDGASGRAG